MILISCVDNARGLRFNHRRQSRDRELCRRILELAGEALWLHEDSLDLFASFPEAELRVTESPERVPEGGVCFWEEPVSDGLEPEGIVLYLWNRDYPADEFFAFPGGEDAWALSESLDFPGFSHPEIREEYYVKKE